MQSDKTVLASQRAKASQPYSKSVCASVQFNSIHYRKVKIQQKRKKQKKIVWNFFFFFEKFVAGLKSVQAKYYIELERSNEFWKVSSFNLKWCENFVYLFVLYWFGVECATFFSFIFFFSLFICPLSLALANTHKKKNTHIPSLGWCMKILIEQKKLQEKKVKWSEEKHTWENIAKRNIRFSGNEKKCYDELWIHWSWIVILFMLWIWCDDDDSDNVYWDLLGKLCRRFVWSCDLRPAVDWSGGVCALYFNVYDGRFISSINW